MSASVHLARRQQRAAADAVPASHYTAVVTRAPASLAGQVGVVLPYADDEGTILHMIPSWPAPSATVLPAVDDYCIVVFCDTGDPAIVGWKKPGWGP